MTNAKEERTSNGMKQSIWEIFHENEVSVDEEKE